MAFLRGPTRSIKPLTAAALHEIPKFKEEIKAKLPSLQRRAIRRYKVAHSEAVVLELREDGHVEAAEYLEFLFELDEEIKKSVGPHALIWNKPRLKYNKELIDELRKMLTNVFSKKKARTVSLIEEALRVENLSCEWWWLADTLYRSAFHVAKEIKIEKSENEIVNLLRYLYAKLLFEKLGKANLALEYVCLARQESRDRLWTAPTALGFKQEDTLFSQCCVLMHNVLVGIAQEMRASHDAEAAVHSCQLALDSAYESCQKELVAKAFYELGESQVAAGTAKDAIEQFSSSLAILEEIPDPEGICNIHSRLAITYTAINDEEKVLEHFQKFKDTASEFNLPHEYAKAHYLTGEFYLARNRPEKATVNFEIAFSMYSRLGARNDANRARCLMGISKGQKLMEKYHALIKMDALLKIIIWKDRGESFD